MSYIGPPKITVSDFLFKVLSSLISGIVGSIVLMAIFLLNASILNSVLKEASDKPHPLFLMIFLSMIFLSIVAANLAYTAFGLLNKRSYHLATLLYQVFIANVLLFLII